MEIKSQFPWNLKNKLPWHSPVGQCNIPDSAWPSPPEEVLYSRKSAIFSGGPNWGSWIYRAPWGPNLPAERETRRLHKSKKKSPWKNITTNSKKATSNSSKLSGMTSWIIGLVAMTTDSDLFSLLLPKQQENNSIDDMLFKTCVDLVTKEFNEVVMEMFWWGFLVENRFPRERVARRRRVVICGFF